jgi:8-oxo-dGTP diphosphatase
MIVQLAGCIIVNADHDILMLHRHTNEYDHWEIPGGKIEPGEAAEQTAKRELEEETGMSVEIKQMLAQVNFSDNGRDFNYRFFLADSQDDPRVLEPTLFSECDFVPTNDLIKGRRNLSEAAKKFADLLKFGQITL